jgi:processive 1,2-diacylglycerol beta-glucosyltransferase
MVSPEANVLRQRFFAMGGPFTERATRGADSIAPRWRGPAADGAGPADDGMMPSMFNRVLIMSASVGAGHVRAAQALEKAFAAAGTARQVMNVDTLDYTNKVFRKLYGEAYFDLANKAPSLLGWLYDRMDKPWTHDGLTHAFNKLNTAPFVRLLKEYQPDIAVCTHFLPADIISRLKARHRMTCPLAVVVTDFDAHALWLIRRVDRYFVPIEETRVHLTKLGVPPDQIAVTGIPIDPLFAQPRDKAAMRAKFGLAADRAVILVSAGGLGMDSVRQIVMSLADLRHPAQVLALCGKNAPLKAKLEKWAQGLAPDVGARFRILGYTTEMDQYMASADLIIGKPGGLTSSEALARGLAMAIVNPIPGQEERNSDHLLEEGCGLRCNNLPALPFKIDRLLDDPARLAAMQAGARRFARPHAAADIVQSLQDFAPVEREE